MDILAWQQSADPNGIIYSESDLTKSSAVVNLFKGCKEGKGFINADGWEFLFKSYQIDGVLDLDNESKWFDQKEKKERVIALLLESLMAGYNPINEEKGDFDTENSDFLSFTGLKRKIDWEFISKEFE